MKQPTKFTLSSLAAIAGTSIIRATSAFAANTTANATSSDICNTGASAEIKAAAGCSGYGTSGQLPNTITGILNGIIAVTGLVSAIYIVIGGIQYMTSAGDTSKLEKAKKTILYALIGLIICALAFAIVNFVISKIK